MPFFYIKKKKQNIFFPEYSVMNLGKLVGGQGAPAEWKLGDIPGSDQGRLQSHPPIPPSCQSRARALAGRGAAASFPCSQIKRTDSPFSAHSAHTMGEGDQRQNYKCEPLMHQVEQWASEASALSEEQYS